MEEEIVTIEEEVEELMTVLEEDVLYCNDYELLENKPKIDGVELNKETTISDLGLATLTDLSGKVDKVAGKGLSTNDLTDTLKTNYDTAYSNTHTHNNKTALDLVSGTNTGDETNSSIITKIGYTPENVANKDQANGYSSLDGGGKVPLSNLPSTLLKYIGVWNASTNTPTLTSPDTTKKGNVYVVSASGTQFGISFKMGDWLIYNDNGVPEKSDNSDDVVSVNNKTGTVVLNTDDISDTDKTNKFVTSAEKTTWNGKAEQTQLPYFQVKTTIDATLLLGTIYRLGTLSGNLSFALPDPTTAVLQEIALIFNLDSNLRTLTITGTNFYPSTLTLVVNLGYVIRLVSDGTKWVVGKRSFVKA